MNILIAVVFLIVIIALAVWVFLWFKDKCNHSPHESRFLDIERSFPLASSSSKYVTMNPSVTKYGDGFLFAYRVCPNKILWESRIGLSFLSSKTISYGSPFELSEFKKAKVFPEDESEVIFSDTPAKAVFVSGYEDPRVFVADGQLYCLAVLVTTVKKKFLPISRMYLIKLNPSNETLEGKELTVEFDDPLESQKNWNAFEYKGETLFSTRVEPHVIAKIDFSTGRATKLYSTSYQGLVQVKKEPNTRIHGGSSPVLLKTKMGDIYIAIAHTKKMRYAVTSYKSFFYAFRAEPPFDVLGYSKDFSLPSAQIFSSCIFDSDPRQPSEKAERIQMITGLADFDENSVLLTCGFSNQFMKGFLVSKEVVKRELGFV